MQRYAMLFGTYMGIFWILKFIMFPLGLSFPFLLFLFVGLTLCVPFMGYYYTKIYRNQACEGHIGFMHAWLFTIFMYIFASLLTAVAHYVYFRFIDNGFILDTLERIWTEAEANNVPGVSAYIAQMKETLSIVRTLNAVDITMQLMSQNVFYCSILAIPTALFVMRKKRNTEVIE